MHRQLGGTQARGACETSFTHANSASTRGRDSVLRTSRTRSAGAPAKARSIRNSSRIVRNATRAGFGRVVEAGLEEEPAQVGPTPGALGAELADHLVELGATVDEQRAVAEAGELPSHVFAVLGVGESEHDLLLVGVAPQASLPELAVGAVLHGEPGVVGLQPPTRPEPLRHGFDDSTEQRGTRRSDHPPGEHVGVRVRSLPGPSAPPAGSWAGDRRTCRRGPSPAYRPSPAAPWASSARDEPSKTRRWVAHQRTRGNLWRRGPSANTGGTCSATG